MNLHAILQQFTSLFQWWVVVAPWEQALRIRAGKHVRVLSGGLFLRIPIIDRFYRQSVRRRIVLVLPQTITTADGKVITMGGSLGFVIKDIRQLFDTLESPDDTLSAMVAATVAEFVVERPLSECGVRAIENHVRNSLNLERFGLGDQEFYLTSYVCVRTHRFITGELPMWSRGNLMTMHEDSKAANLPF